MPTNSQRKRAQKPKADAPVDEATEAVDLDCVVVIVQRGEDGAISTDVVPQGDVRPTEVDTILELGRNGWRQKIGLVKG